MQSGLFSMFPDAAGSAICSPFLLLEQLVIVIAIKIATRLLDDALMATWAFVSRPDVLAIRLS